MVAPLADVFQAEEASALVCVEFEQNSSHPTVISDQERMDQALFGPAARKFDADRTLGGDRIMRREGEDRHRIPGGRWRGTLL